MVVKINVPVNYLVGLGKASRFAPIDTFHMTGTEATNFAVHTAKNYVLN